MPTKGPHNRPSIEKAEWVAEAVRLSNKGWSYRRIGARVSRHWTTVEEALKAEFERVRAPAEEVALRRARLSEMVERQIASWHPRSLAGDKDAAVAANRFFERYAKLWGLDAPARSEVTGSEGGPVVFTFAEQFPDEQLRAFAAADDAGDAGGTPRGGES